MIRRSTLTVALSLLFVAAVPGMAAEEEAESDDQPLVLFSKEKPAPAPSEGKALVVVVRPAKIGYAIKSFFFADATPLGINKGTSYFFAHVDPGTHVFWSKSENVDALELAVEAGKTYYIQQHVQMGGFRARTKLEVLPEEEGKALLEKCSRYASMTARGRTRAEEIAVEHQDDTREDLERRAKKAEKSP